MDKIKLLIADDEIELCEMFKEILERGWDKYIISTAYSGPEALSLLENEEFDVLVTDIRMPSMDGIELMKNANEIQKEIQTIIVTGHGDMDNAIEALRQGANNYLTKPFSGERLHLAVTNAWEKRMLSRKLRESESQFRSMFEQNSIPMLLIDPETGSIVKANRAASEFYGYTIQELTVMKITDINMLPKKQVLEKMQHVKSVEKQHFIFPHRLKSGEIRTVEVNSTPLEVNNKKLLFSIIHDIEDRRQAKEALRESERRYRTLFDSASDSILVHDFENRFLDVNRATCEITGYSREELLEMPLGDMFLPENIYLVIRKLELLNPEDHIVFESVQKRRDSEPIPIEGKSSVIEYDDKKAVLTIVRDLRERKKVEEEREKLRDRLRQAQKVESIGTLAGGIAHDFNNILYGIMGYTEMAMDQISEAGASGCLEKVLKSSYRAKDLIQQILSFSRQDEQERMPLKIQYIIKEALTLLRATLPATIEIRQNIGKECGPVLTDPTQIHQILMNLCTNAYHAMWEKGGVLEIRLDETEFDSDGVAAYPGMDPGQYLKLSVNDTGHGMSHEVMQRIFDPYFTTKEKGKGTGLGLSVVHGIVKSHDGHISVHSDLGKGTVFNVYLPLIGNQPDITETVAATPVPGGNENILLVEDESHILEMEQRMLKKLGYNVTARSSSIEALEAFRNQPEKFDLIFTDMTMPNMTGMELSKEIMMMRPDIPVILCTGFSELVTEERAKLIGIREFIMKPVLKNEMDKAIRRALNNDEW